MAVSKQVTETPEATMARVKAELAAAGTPTGATRQAGIEKAAGVTAAPAASPVAATPTKMATLVNKATGERKAVASGSQEAQALFGKGFTLETPPPLTAGGAFVEQVNKLTQEKITAKRDELLSAPENYDTQVALQRGTLYEALAEEATALTPEKLRWLTPEQQAAIRSGNKDLIKNSIIGLNSILQFREETKAAETEQAMKQFELLSQSGAPVDSLPPGVLEKLDADAGLPSGTYRAIYTATIEKASVESETTQLENASKLASILGSIPSGKSITVGGTTYTGWGTGNLLSGTEEDSNGNVTHWSVDPATGQITTTNLGPIGTASGWERETDINGVIWSVNPATGQRKMLVDPNAPNGGYASGGVISLFPTGTVLDRGQCGEFVNDLTGIGVGDTFASKMAMMDPSITADSAQVGDVVTISSGTTGHIGIINNIQTAADGTVQYQLTESNWSGPETVSHSRWVNASQVSGFARPGFLDPAYNFGTDAPNVPEPLTTEEVKKTSEATKMAGIVKLNRAIDDYKLLIEEHGSASGFTKSDRTLLDSAKEKINLAIKDAEALGALQAPDIELIERMIPDVTSEGFFNSLIPKPFQASRALSALEQVKSQYSVTAQDYYDLLVSSGAATDDPYLVELADKLGITPKIQVREKSSGLTGMIPVDEFDANLYEKL